MTVFQGTREGKLPISATQIKPHSEHVTINTKQNNLKKRRHHKQKKGERRGSTIEH